MGKPLEIAKDILPVGDFKTHASRVLKQLREGGRPVVITQHGRPAGVLLSPEEYDRLSEREHFARSVEKGLADAEAGRVITDEDLGKRLDDLFGPLASK